MKRAIAEITAFSGLIGDPEKHKLFGERRNSYLERAIAEMTLLRRAADSSPYAMFGKTTYFFIRRL